MDCANTQKLKTSKVTYPNKALRRVTVMPSYQETVEVMATINLNLQHTGSTFPRIFTGNDLLTLRFICAKTFLNT